MNIETVKARIHAKLYGEELTRGVVEFSWGSNDPNLFNDRLAAAKGECMKIGVRWVDADPMSARIVIVTPKEHEQAVVDIIKKYSFDIINKIFDPKPVEMLSGKDTP